MKTEIRKQAEEVLSQLKKERVMLAQAQINLRSKELECLKKIELTEQLLEE